MYFKRSGFQHAKSVYLETLDEEGHKPEMDKEKMGTLCWFLFQYSSVMQSDHPQHIWNNQSYASQDYLQENTCDSFFSIKLQVVGVQICKNEPLTSDVFL